MFLDNGISDVVCKMRIIYSASNWNLEIIREKKEGKELLTRITERA